MLEWTSRICVCMAVSAAGDLEPRRLPRSDVDKNKHPDLVVGSSDDTAASAQSSTSTVTADATKIKPRFFGSVDNGKSGPFLSMPKTLGNLEVGLQSLILGDKVEPLVFSPECLSAKEVSKTECCAGPERSVLSQTPQPIRNRSTYKRACGPDNCCYSNSVDDGPVHRWKPETLLCIFRQNGSQVFAISNSIKRLSLEVNICNMPSLDRPAEDAHNAILNISIPPSLSYSAVRTKGDTSAPVKCSGDTVLLCELGNPFKSNQMVQVLIIFQPSDISLDTREIRSLLQLSTLSEQSDLSPLSVSMLVEYSLQTSLFLISHPDPTLQWLLIGAHQVEVTPVTWRWSLTLAEGSVHRKWLLHPSQRSMNGTSELLAVAPPNIINFPTSWQPRNISPRDSFQNKNSSLSDTGHQVDSSALVVIPVVSVLAWGVLLASDLPVALEGGSTERLSEARARGGPHEEPAVRHEGLTRGALSGGLMLPEALL
ncbi:integrin alpha-3-like isoform X1 [Lates japonicus]|uniref:Integrin alpha-3-like isoform X1 n=1 Tax=Lates japonicus TaxID=270547 RepID=A0AAD3NAP1_LATJO|nr:integrin alpha-3-like isoform X1 [Lates japonicus]